MKGREPQYKPFYRPNANFMSINNASYRMLQKHISIFKILTAMLSFTLLPPRRERQPKGINTGFVPFGCLHTINRKGCAAKLKSPKKHLYVPMHDKVPDAGVTKLMLPSLLGLVACMFCLAASTWAWFTASASVSAQPIQTSQYSVTVTGTVQTLENSAAAPAARTAAQAEDVVLSEDEILSADDTVPDGEEVVPTAIIPMSVETTQTGPDQLVVTVVDGISRLTLLPGTNTITLAAAGNASSGYCTVQIGEMLYYAAPAVDGTFTFTVRVSAKTLMMVTPHWGVEPLADAGTLITNGWQLNLAPGAPDTSSPDTSAGEPQESDEPMEPDADDTTPAASERDDSMEPTQPSADGTAGTDDSEPPAVSMPDDPSNDEQPDDAGESTGAVDPFVPGSDAEPPVDPTQPPASSSSEAPVSSAAQPAEQNKTAQLPAEDLPAQELVISAEG